MNFLLNVFFVFIVIANAESAFARYCENGQPPPKGCYCAGDFPRCPIPRTPVECVNSTTGASPCYVWVNHCQSATDRDPNGADAQYWCNLAKSCSGEL